MTNVQSFAKLNCNLKTLYCTDNKKIDAYSIKDWFVVPAAVAGRGQMPPVLSGLWKVVTFKLDMNSIHLTVTICYSWCPISISLKPLIHSLVGIPTHLMLLIVLLLTAESTVYHFHFQSTLQTHPTFLFMFLTGCLHCLCIT